MSVFGPNHAEVAAVEGGDGGDAKAFRGRDDGRVHRAQGQAPVSGDEFGDPEPVGGAHRLDRERAAGEVTEEAHLGVGAQPGRDQVRDLGDHQLGDYQRPRMRLQELAAGQVVTVVRVDVSVQGARIEEDSYLEISELRISSIRSAMSLAPLCPVPAARSCRGVPVLKYASRASLVTTAMGTPLSSASWRRMASRLSGSFTVVRLMICQHTSTQYVVEHR